MKKNLMLCVVILSLSVGAHAGSILPDRIVTPLLDLFSNRNRETPEGKIEVMVTTFESQKMKPRDRKAKDAGGNEYDDDYKITDSAGELTRNGDRIVLGADQYQQFKKLASAVYRMIPHSYSSGGMSGPSEIIYVGTAFHIGNNLVLTNVHVLSHSFDNLTECGRFELKEAASQTTYTCKKVHFCSKEHDICLIEMNTNKKTFCRGNDCEM